MNQKETKNVNFQKVFPFRPHDPARIFTQNAALPTYVHTGKLFRLHNM